MNIPLIMIVSLLSGVFCGFFIGRLIDALPKIIGWFHG